jgi:recombinational DNA repair ATPase RecF
LDDVLSELDEKRKSFILERIGGYQVIITDCSKDARPQGATVLQVVEGKTEIL